MTLPPLEYRPIVRTPRATQLIRVCVTQGKANPPAVARGYRLVTYRADAPPVPCMKASISSRVTVPSWLVSIALKTWPDRRRSSVRVSAIGVVSVIGELSYDCAVMHYVPAPGMKQRI